MIQEWTYWLDMMQQLDEPKLLEEAFEKPVVLREFSEQEIPSLIDAASGSFCTRGATFYCDGVITQLPMAAEKIEHIFVLASKTIFKCRAGEADIIAENVDDFVYIKECQLISFWDQNLVLQDARSARRLYLEAPKPVSMCNVNHTILLTTSEGELMSVDLTKPQEGIRPVGKLIEGIITGMQALGPYLMVWRSNSSDLYTLDRFALHKTFLGARRAELTDISGEFYAIDYQRGQCWRIRDFARFSITRSSVFDREEFIYGQVLFRIL